MAPKKTSKKTSRSGSRSGTSRSYADRVAKGRPNVTFSLPAETIEILKKLAARRGLSRSAVVDLAVRELAERKECWNWKGQMKEASTKWLLVLVRANETARSPCKEALEAAKRELNERSVDADLFRT